MKTQKGRTGYTEDDTGHFSECFPDTIVISCSIIVSNDWLYALCNTQSNTVEKSTDLCDNTNTGQWDITPISGKLAVMPQYIIQYNADDRTGKLHGPGSDPDLNDL